MKVTELCTDSLQSHGLYSPWNSPGQNTGVGSLSLLQGIFAVQGLNPGLMAGRFFTSWATGEPKYLPMQETQVVSLIWEDPTCHGETEPMHHNHRACALEPRSTTTGPSLSNYWSLCALEPVLHGSCSASAMRTHVLQPESRHPPHNWRKAQTATKT